MKNIGILLLVLVTVFSGKVSAQPHDLASLPKWYAASIRERSQSQQETSSTDPAPVKTISLSTGVKLEYIEQGNADGIPVILLHGFPDSWRSYEQVLPLLPKSYHVFAISQRGHGNSDRPANGYNMKDFAADIAAFMKALGIPPAVIVGHSMGASITQQFAVSYPELVRGIVLEGAMAAPGEKKDFIEYALVVDQLSDPIDSAMSYEFQASTLANPISKEYFNVLLEESRKVPAHVWKGVFRALLAIDVRQELRQFTKPALIIWGDKDNFGPRSDQDFFASAMKRAQFVIYKGTGHSLHWEEPARFSADLVKFVESIQ